MNRTSIKDFNENIRTWLRRSFCYAAIGYYDVADVMTDKKERAVAGAARLGSRALEEAALVEEGAVHLRTAPAEIKTDLKRDVATCAVETGLAVAENVSLAANVTVASLETAEKIFHTPRGKRNPLRLMAEFAESVISNAVAAGHAAANIVHDLERAGASWRDGQPGHKLLVRG